MSINPYSLNDSKEINTVTLPKVETLLKKYEPHIIEFNAYGKTINNKIEHFIAVGLDDSENLVFVTDKDNAYFKEELKEESLSKFITIIYRNAYNC